MKRYYNCGTAAMEAGQPKKRRRGAKAEAAARGAVLGQVDYNATEEVGAKGGKHQHPRKVQQAQGQADDQNQQPVSNQQQPAKAAAAAAAPEEPEELTTPAGKLRGYHNFPSRFLFPYDDAENQPRAKRALYRKPYVAAMIKNLYKREHEMIDLNPNYMTEVQDDIKPRMRVILYNWLIDVDLKFKLRQEVLWRTFQIIDRYLSKRNVNRKQLQLVGCASMWIASKYFEIYPPTPSDLVNISDKAFTKAQLFAMEIDICQALDMQLSFPTAAEFMQRFMEVALSGLSPVLSRNGPLVRMDTEAQVVKMQTRVKFLGHYIMERFALTDESVKMKPSLMAAAALYTTLALTSFRWTSSLAAATGYTSEDLRVKYGLYRKMKNSIMQFAETKHDAVIRKYASEKRGSVSNLRRKKSE